MRFTSGNGKGSISTPTLGFEMIPCLVLVAVGVWLWLPMQTMTKISPLLTLMLKALPEWVWGWIFFLPGAFQFRVLWIGPVKARKVAALFAFVFLAFLVILAVLESPYSLLIPILSVLALFEAITVRRIKNTMEQIEKIEQKEQRLCKG